MMHNDRASSRTPTPTPRAPLRRSLMDPYEARSLTLDDADSTTNLLVGSPDQLPYTSPSRSSAHDFGDGSAPRPRPTMGKRSTSSPYNVRQRTSTAQPGPSSVSSRPGFSLAPPPDHQWTLFGQLMENEVPYADLRTSSSTPTGHRVRSALVTSPQSSMIVGESGLLEPPNVVRSRLSSPSRESSPVRPSPGRFQEDDTPYESDTSTVSEDSDSEDDTPGTPTQARSSWWTRVPDIPPLYRNIFKCSLAYFLASLFTYMPALSRLIGSITSYGPGSTKPSPSAHLVASIAVYYNPAKTMGGMIEADLFCALGVFYAAFVSVASMSLYWWLELSPGLEWLGDVIAIIWIGISMSGVAWAKVWMANPSFNTACSMMVILISTVVVKEGGIHTLLQVAAIVGFGSLISNIVCLCIWPQTATQNLQNNMSKTLDSFSTVLNMLTNTFLLEGGVHSKSHLEKMQRAVENHQSSFTSLKKSLGEARTEWVPRGDGPTSWAANSGKAAYEDTVDSLNRLGQHLNGLRSGTRLQYELTRAGMSRRQRRRDKRREQEGVGLESLTEEDEEGAMLKAAADMFGDVVDELGPPLKALSSSCTASLKRLKEAFEHSHAGKRKGGFSSAEFIELMDGIERSLVRFESTSNHAVLRWYRRSDNLTDSHQSIASVSTSRGDYIVNPLTAGNDNEDIFLVYFFIFTLQEFAREMTSLIDAMRRIYAFEHERAHRDKWWTRFFKNLFTKDEQKNRRPREGLRKRISTYMKYEGRHPVPAFPKVRPHAPDTLQTPSRHELTWVGRIKQTLWTIGSRLTERDSKYAFKAGMAMAILASPAFFDNTRPIFVEFQGEWALISFFVVISPTIGATNNLSLQRIFCTLFGAAVAAGIYSLFPEDPVILSAFGFFYSIPCFYLGLSRPEYGTASRFLLLTYNLTCLYSYNAREKDLSVIYVATHRAVAVTAGVVWAAIVSRLWWPTEARRELLHALTEFCLNTGWLYSRLVASNSFAPEYRREDGAGEAETEMTEASTFQLTRLNNSIREFMAMELHLQIKLIELQGLLALTQHEPRLKGPFPVLLYRGILTSLQTILDRLHSIRCVTTREEWYTSVRRDFIIPVNRERHEMVGNILLSFSVLASAFKLKTPLPPYLPPAEKARQRLVEAIRKLDVVRNREVKGSRQLLFFAYALAMKGVTEELESLGKTLQNAFGVIGESAEEFEALFLPAEDSHRRLDDAA